MTQRHAWQRKSIRKSFQDLQQSAKEFYRYSTPLKGSMGRISALMSCFDGKSDNYWVRWPFFNRNLYLNILNHTPEKTKRPTENDVSRKPVYGCLSKLDTGTNSSENSNRFSASIVESLKFVEMPFGRKGGGEKVVALQPTRFHALLQFNKI